MPFLRFRRIVLAALFCASLLVTSFGGYLSVQAQSSPAQVSNLSFTEGIQETVLDNGLTVLMKPVPAAPVVNVQLAYGVGHVNEQEGEIGLSHQLEHMLFRGTDERPIQFGRLFSALGSQFNAFVSNDQTVYFNTVGRNKLEAILTLEADRMKNAVLSPEQFPQEQQVVISELQGADNDPSYLLRKEVLKAAYPDRAYGEPVGGVKADVEAFTIEQTRAYYEKYYNPNNATLIVVGDFEPQATLETVNALFGSLENTQEPTLDGLVPAMDAISANPQSEPLVVNAPGGLPLVQVVYPLPNITHPDAPAIELLDAILTKGRSSQLNQALVETGIAASVDAYPELPQEPGWYTLQLTAAPGQSPSDIYEQFQQSLSDIQQNSVSPDELARAKEQFKANIGLLNQDISSQGRLLSIIATSAGDYQAIDDYIAGIAAVTPEDVLRVAQTYFVPEKSVVGFFEPTAGTASAAVPPSVPGSGESFAPSEPVDPSEVAQYLPPVSESVAMSQALPEEVVLDNDLKVLLLPSSGSPTVSLTGWMNAGERFDPQGKAGIASLTAANVINGTENQDALTLAQKIEGQGVRFSGFETGQEGVNFSADFLSEDLPLVVETLADVLQNPAFPPELFELSQQQALSGLAAELSNPRAVTIRTFQQAVYPEGHPDHALPTEESLSAMTLEDVKAFYEAYYRPDGTVLTLVGDFDGDEVRSQLTTAFGNWTSTGEQPTVSVPSVPLPDSSVRLKESLPGTAEAITVMGYNAIARTDPRYYPLIVANEAIGGSTISSRLGDELRDRQGLTYGVSSRVNAGRDNGQFTISMQTDPSNVDRAVESAIAILEQIRTEGISAEEVDSSKRTLSDRYPVTLADPSTLSAILLRNSVYELGEQEIQQFQQKVGAVTVEQVQAAIDELVLPDKLVIVTTAP